MKANYDKSKQSGKATRRVLAGVLCGASVLSLVLSLVMPPISQAIANGTQEVSAEEVVADESTLGEEAGADNSTGKDAKNQNSSDAENEANEDTVAPDSTADDAEAEGAAQPSDAQTSDDENSDENAIAPASVSDDDYAKVNGDVSGKFDDGGKFQLTGPAYSDAQIAITKDTTIDLAGQMLCNRHGGLDSFFVVKDKATLTIEDSGINKKDEQTKVKTQAGQLAAMEWEKGTGSNGSTPKSLTYYETKSVPKQDEPGTTETTTKHVVTGFGAIDAASVSGSVKYVVNVEAGGILNLKGGMITTAANLGNSGHVILSQGAVNISGGYVTNGNDGGWGGGLCVTGANAKLNMTNGVIAANKAASGGGIYADQGATLNLSGGVISGNATYGNTINNGDDTNAGGYGGGVYTKGANVTISGSACITNNRVNDRVTDNLYNNGVLGGGGIACTHGGTLTMTDGSVTANYSHEAGGGIYAGFWNQWIKFKMTGGIIAGNMSENAEGGGLRISTGTTGDIGTEPGTSNKIYITNNKTMTGSTNGRGGDWGGGGIFIQQGGKLNIVQTLITNNEAGGWGGGVGACPTGETIVSHSNGAAIYNNADYGEHFSAGGHDKDFDQNTDYISDPFENHGHRDFFLVRNNDSQNTVAVVLGKMLGGESAGWQGTCDRIPITIDPNGGAEAKYMFGLQANPSPDAVNKAQAAATTIISGNCSYTNGGGIMTNGDLVVGKVEALNVYPAIKVKANKVLKKDGSTQSLSGHGYQFKLLGKAVGSDGEPYWNENGTLNASGCEATPEVTVNDEGEIVIDTAANFQSGNYDLYLVEVPVDEKGTTFDQTIYKIHVSVSANPVTTTLMGIKINRYVVDTGASKVSVKKRGDTGFTPYDFYNWNVDPADSAVSTVTIGNDSNPAFTNELAPYQTSGTWTPQVTKMVDGGEMKKFKFKLYAENTDNTEKTFQPIYASTSGSENPQTVKFDPVEIGPLGVDKLDSHRQAKFTYYIRECDANENEGTEHDGYKNDTKTFKVVVTAKDDGKGHLTCTPTYYEVDANGNPSSTSTDTPTFTNTYSTSLPLSGMSGVTLTYLAGAAVLCAAAAWMHIRRKANAKGGKRRE